MALSLTPERLAQNRIEAPAARKRPRPVLNAHASGIFRSK
jgi:hypothetical protein